MKPLVSIIMGSTSDWPIMKKAANLFEDMEIPFEVNALSAHRTPERMVEYGKNAHSNGISVIIAGAGGAAHLPGMIASLTHLPVIGVPVKSSNSIVFMASDSVIISSCNFSPGLIPTVS